MRSKRLPPRKKARNSPKTAKTSEDIPAAAPPPSIVPVVGIGASAGGLEAFRELLQALPNDTGMAFVLVSHLNKTHKSILSQLLAKMTQMPVAEVRGEMQVEANHIYVIPPNAMLAIQDGSLSPNTIQDASRPVMVIDAFFRSLAEHRKSQAIGVVLSGTGSDGTLGLAAIRAEGGIAFAQDQQSAQYPDMPRNASAQFGAADFVLPPAQIAQELARIAGHPYVRQTKAEENGEPPTLEGQFAAIFRFVRRCTGVDFSQYKPPTLRRRISRRMVLNKVDSVAAYRARLEDDPAEVEALYSDLLINVTSFFRDPDSFEYLEKFVIPSILTDRRGDLPIRVWVPGCATGEEVYSIAMLLFAALEESSAGPPPVQIFGTDISHQSIQKARAGLYSENIVGDVSPERLAKFFTKLTNGYQVNKQVRDLCVFAVQNVAKDPPFSRMDLIVCRNLLIYLGAPLQKKVLATFHYALNASGYLFLGSSESVEAGSDAFHQLEKKYKIYSKLLSQSLPHLEFGPSELAEDPIGFKSRSVFRPAMDLGQEVDRLVLARYSPPGVLINSSFEILQFRGHTGPFLESPPGQATLSLLKMAREGLAVDLRALVLHASKTGGPVRKAGIRIKLDSGLADLALEVTPIIDRSVKDPYYLVLFESTPIPPAEKRATEALAGRKSKNGATREVEALRGELAGTQKDLRSIIEEQEATNEELQSASEEILSSNEELQSTNEELETSKEELQATNEELITLNDELQSRNGELATVNSDLNNLIDSLDVAHVMLDNDLRIRRFTSAAQRLFNLIHTDVGRPIGDIKPNIQVDDLSKLILESMASARQREQNVRDFSGRSYAMKIRPYKTREGKTEGAMLALADVDALLRSRENGLDLESSLRSLLKQPPDLLLAVVPEGQCLFLNSSAFAAVRRPGGSIFEHLSPHDREPLRRCLRQALETREPIEIEVRKFALRQTPGPAILTVEPILTGEGVLAFAVRVAGKEKGARAAFATQGSSTAR
ncbi:MAG: PAS domain-containing protein [Bryobacterales bacterium]|nr:PAS domain-containing protein [Bryobacterales bacterium]